MAEKNGQADVKITPEMLKAGLETYYEFDLIDDDPRRIISGVFEAMLRAREQPRPSHRGIVL